MKNDRDHWKKSLEFILRQSYEIICKMEFRIRKDGGVEVRGLRSQQRVGFARPLIAIKLR
jgi:hypothetical protein